MGFAADAQLGAQLLERARRVALSESTVLVTGSTGTGKELLARAIHDASARAHHPIETPLRRIDVTQVAPTRGSTPPAAPPAAMAPL